MPFANDERYEWDTSVPERSPSVLLPGQIARSSLCPSCCHYQLHATHTSGPRPLPAASRACTQVARGLTPTVAARGGWLAKDRVRVKGGPEGDECPRYMTTAEPHPATGG